MLQTGHANSSIGDEYGARNEPDFAGTLDSMLGFARRQYLVVSVVTLLALALGVCYVVITPPTYIAKAQLVLNGDLLKGSIVQKQSLVADAPIDSARIENQLQILKSGGIAISVIKKLRLQDDPEFVGIENRRSLVISSRGFGEFDKPKSESELLQPAVNVFLDQLEAKRVGMSYIIEIGFQSRNASKAAMIANAVADAYISDQLEAKHEANRQASFWLQERLSELREQASNADQTVIKFKADNNIAVSGGRPINDQQIEQLNSQLIAARSRASESFARLRQIQDVIRTDQPDATLTATVSDALNNPIVQKLRQQFLELVNRERDWSQRYGQNHIAVTQLRSQIKEIRGSILEELKRLAETYRSDYQIAKIREQEVEKELSNLMSRAVVSNDAQVSLRELESASVSYRTLYDSFLRQYTEYGEQQPFPISDVRVILRATPPPAKSRPKSLLILAICAMGGIGAGIGVGLLRELTDRTFRTIKQVEAVLDRSSVALVPLIEGGSGQHSSAGQAQFGFWGRGSVARNSNIFSELINSPTSHFAEAIRSVKFAVDMANSNRARQSSVIGFTSALPNEGKSTIAAAFAQLVNQVGCRAILVDCDLRNPSLSREYASGANCGIVDAIFGKNSLEEAIWRDPATNLAILPVAAATRFLHSSEILASGWTKKLFDELRSRYDYVIVDLPPLTPIIDVRATTKFIDSYFLVIEWGNTKIDVVKRALHTSHEIGENLVGAVLNKTDLKSLLRYDRHCEKYYYNRDFARYGYTTK